MTSSLLEKRKPRKRIHTQEFQIEDFVFNEEAKPIVTHGNKLEIDSNILETEHVYFFNFLDTKMVLWKLKDGTIGLYQVVEE